MPTKEKQAEYMRQYWKNHPSEYSIHKSNIMINRNRKKFIEKIENMENLIYSYLGKQLFS